MNSKIPNYNKIYEDLILRKFPEKAETLIPEVKNKVFTVLEVIRFNEKLFGKPDKDIIHENQKHRSYNISTIFEILDFQKKNGLNNSQLAIHYRLSRNTITKWKKKYFSIDSKDKKD